MRGARAWAAVVAVAGVLAAAGPVRAAGTREPGPGSIVSYLSDPLLGAQRVHAFVQRGGPTLLFSDDPEVVPGPGILYQDTVSGAFRVFFDHVDGSAGPLAFSVLATNRGERPVHIRLGRVGEAGPSEAVLANGQAAQHAWMGSAGGGTLTLAPGRTAFLDPAAAPQTAQPGQNVTGILDATADGNVLVSIVAQRQPAADISGLAVLPATPSPTGFIGRGTFRHADFSLTAQGDGGMQYVQVASPISYLRGFSAVDGVPTEDYGNYGVLYNMHVTVTAGRDEHMAAVFDPLGGAFAGAALLGVGFVPGTVVDMPSDGGFSPSPTSGILLGRYALTAETPVNLHVEWMPPSGSSLPASLLLESD